MDSTGDCQSQVIIVNPNAEHQHSYTILNATEGDDRQNEKIRDSGFTNGNKFRASVADGDRQPCPFQAELTFCMREYTKLKGVETNTMAPAGQSATGDERQSRLSNQVLPTVNFMQSYQVSQMQVKASRMQRRTNRRVDQKTKKDARQSQATCKLKFPSEVGITIHMRTASDERKLDPDSHGGPKKETRRQDSLIQ
jgi:hypothetical protein